MRDAVLLPNTTVGLQKKEYSEGPPTGTDGIRFFSLKSSISALSIVHHSFSMLVNSNFTEMYCRQKINLYHILSLVISFFPLSGSH